MQGVSFLVWWNDVFSGARSGRQRLAMGRSRAPAVRDTARRKPSEQASARKRRLPRRSATFANCGRVSGKIGSCRIPRKNTLLKQGVLFAMLSKFWRAEKGWRWAELSEQPGMQLFTSLTKQRCTDPATTGQAMLQLFPAFERAGATFANGERLGKGR